MAIAVLITLYGLAGCHSSASDQPASALPHVSVMTVQRASVPVTLELPGRTSPYLVSQVRARVDGIVQKRTFDEGADVKAGQPLYQIDPAQYEVALQSAQASLEKARSNYEAQKLQADRSKVLLAGNAISKQAYDTAIAAAGQAHADVASAQAAVAAANINLGYTKVLSPIAGRSSTSLVTQGAYVQASAATLLTTVQQIDPIYVDLNESSTMGLQLRNDIAAGKIRPDDDSAVKISLTLENGQPYPVQGKLKFNGITVDPATGSVTIRAVFPNPHGVLLPGMFVRARVQQGTNDNAYLVPVSAVTHDSRGNATVMTVDAANKATVKTIQTATTQGANWVVTGGLSHGDRIITTGWQRVQSGMQVDVSADAPPAATAGKVAQADTASAAAAQRQ